MLPMPIANGDLACGCEKEELPIPGLLGWMAGNAELKALRELSGVMVLLVPWAGARFFTGGDTGGVDHEKAGAGEGLLALIARFAAGRDGSVVDDVADADALAQGSPPSMSDPLDGPAAPPRTKASKSTSPLPLEWSNPLLPVAPPKLIRSLRDATAVVEVLAPSS